MKTKLICDRDRLTVIVSGKLDSNTSPEFQSMIQDNLDGVKHLEFDFSNLLYISSAGLRIILSAYKKMCILGGDLVIIEPNDMVCNVMKITGILDKINVRKTDGKS